MSWTLIMQECDKKDIDKGWERYKQRNKEERDE